jgi:hypothetical protein
VNAAERFAAFTSHSMSLNVQVILWALHTETTRLEHRIDQVPTHFRACAREDAEMARRMFAVALRSIDEASR